MTEDENEQCEGCVSYLTAENSIRIHTFSTGIYAFRTCGYNGVNNGQCPCTQCIVKVMCNDMCDDYKTFHKPHRS